MRGGRGAGRKMPNKREGAPMGRRRADPKDDKPDPPAGTRRQNDQNKNADSPSKRGRNASPATRGSPGGRGGSASQGRGGKTPPARGRGRGSPPSRRGRSSPSSRRNKRSSPDRPGSEESQSKRNKDDVEANQLDKNDDGKQSNEKDSLKGFTTSSASGAGKLSDNFGSFMASFFSRQRQLETPAEDAGSAEDSSSSKKKEEESDKGTSASNVEQQEENKPEVKTDSGAGRSVDKMSLEKDDPPVKPDDSKVDIRVEDEPLNKPEDSKIDSTVEEGKSLPNENKPAISASKRCQPPPSKEAAEEIKDNQKKDKKLAFKKPPEMDEPKETSENESLKDESQAKETTSEEGTGSLKKESLTGNDETKALGSVGALLAGLGNWQTAKKPNSSPFTEKRKPAEVEKSPRKSFDKEKSEDKKFKVDVVEQSLDSEGKRKQPWKGEQASSNSGNTSSEAGKFTGDVQSPAKQNKPLKEGKSPQKRPPQNNQDDLDNNERKVTSSIGALLAGLGGRKSHIMSESSKSPLKQERGQKPSVNEPQPGPDNDVEEVRNTAVENKKLQEKPKKEEKKAQKRSFSEANDGDANEDDGGTGNKVTSSIGALLAGLGGRKSRFTEDSKAQENKRKSVKGDHPPAVADDAIEEDKSSQEKPAPKEDQRKTPVQPNKPREDKKPMNKSFEQPKANAKQSAAEDKSQEDNAQAKVTSSIGALLAGLGNRRNQAPEQPEKDASRSTTVNNDDDDDTDDIQIIEQPQPTNERKPKSIPPKKAPPPNEEDEEKRMEHKKSLGLGALLSGLGNRHRGDQPQNNRQSSERERDSQTSNRGRRQVGGFGDFGYVSKSMKMNDNRRGGGWDAPPDSEPQTGNRRGGWDAPQDSEPQRGGKKGGWDAPPDSEPQKGNRGGGWDAPQDNRNRENNKRGWDMGERGTDSQDSFNRKDKKSRFSSDYEEPKQGGRPPTVREEDDVTFVLGHTPRAKPNEKEIENNKKSLANNMSFEEEAERKKTQSIGAMLAGLANRTFPEPPPPQERSRERNYERGYGRSYDRSYGRNSERSSEGSSGKDAFGREIDRNWARKDQPYDDWKSHERRDKDKKSKSKKNDDEPFDVKKAAEKVKSETKRLDEEFGPGVFTVGFTEKRVMAYVCEVCCVQLTENLIEAHTDGMQHLKKKNLWDKKQRMVEEGKNAYTGGRRGWVTVDHEEEKSKTSSPAPTSSAENSNSGYETKYQQNYNQGGYNYNTDQSYGTGYGGKGSGYGGPNKNATVPAAIVNTAIPPPPPPVAEAPAKPKPAKGGATVSLLQRLDACAVKTEKDLDLATSVISALLKSLKEFNHKRGDTKCIEVLTEIDIKFRGLRPKPSASEVKSSGKVNASSSSSSSQPAYSSYGSSDASNTDLINAHKSAWYSQGSGSAPSASSTLTGGKTPSAAQGAAQATASSYGMKTSDGYTSGYSTQPSVESNPPPAVASTGYGQYSMSSGYGTADSSYSNNYYNTSYPVQGTTDNKTSSSQSYPPQGNTNTATKDKTVNYYTQPPPPVVTQGSYVDPSANKDVTNIVYSTSQPPPPPPTNASQNYADANTSQNYAANTSQNYAANTSQNYTTNTSQNYSANTSQNYTAQGYQSAYNMGYYSMPAPLPQYNNQQQY